MKKAQQLWFTFEFCLRKTRTGKSPWRHRFRKAPVSKCFPSTLKTKDDVSNSSGLKTSFEKLRFPGGLADEMPNLRNKLQSQRRWLRASITRAKGRSFYEIKQSSEVAEFGLAKNLCNSSHFHYNGYQRELTIPQQLYICALFITGLQTLIINHTVIPI